MEKQLLMSSIFSSCYKQMSDQNEQIVSESTWSGRNWFSQHPVCTFHHWVAPQIYFFLLCSCSNFCTSYLFVELSFYSCPSGPLFQHNFEKLTSKCSQKQVFERQNIELHIFLAVCPLIFLLEMQDLEEQKRVIFATVSLLSVYHSYYLWKTSLNDIG